MKKVIPLVNKISNNYYHWTSEALTRFAMLKQHCKEDLNEFDILLPENAPEFTKSSLWHLFKWPTKKIIYTKSNDIAIISQCLLASNSFIRSEEIQMTNIYSPQLYKMLNEISLKNIPDDNSITPQYIIISRRNAVQRKLLYEEKILCVFPQIHFEILYTEKIPFVEQVRIFRNAKIIIATHGAALSNLVYTNKDPLVIEIFSSNRKIRDTILFYQMSRALDIKHCVIVKETLNSDQDVIVDKKLLLQVKDIIYSVI